MHSAVLLAVVALAVSFSPPAAHASPMQHPRHSPLNQQTRSSERKPVQYEGVIDTPDPELAKLFTWGHSEAERLLRNHCHAPKPMEETYVPLVVQDLDGNELPGRLVSSSLFVRHGDRTPNVLMPVESDVSYQCDMVDNYVEEIPTRLGNRRMGGLVKSKWTVINPEVKENPHSRVMWRGNCHVGQLTDVGARQHVELGRELGKIYGITSTQEVDGRTSTFWRTRQSAQSILAGLFDPEVRPDINFDTDTPVSLNVTAHESENMVPQSPLCPKVQALHHNRDGKDAVFSNWWDEHKRPREVFDSFMDTSKTHGGEKSGTLEKYFDTITARSCHNPNGPGTWPVFQSGKSGEMHRAALERIVLGANWEILYQYKLADTARLFIKLVLGSFLGQVMDSMANDVKMYQSGEAPKKLHIYSAHDTTISPLLGALLIDNEQFFWPPYASNVLFEMWEVNDEIVVRALYNGRVIRSGGAANTNHCNDGSCIKSDWVECDLGACPLDIFMGVLGAYVPSSPEEYQRECAMRESELPVQ